MNYFFNRPGKRCVSLQTELLVLLAAPLIGPLVIMRACAVIAIDELGGRTARDANGRLPEPIAYARVVAFVEAVFESTPQLAAQTVAYYLSSDDNTTFDTALFVASATLSAGAILKGGATFFYYHSELVSILGAGAVAPLDVLLARGGGTRRSAELHFDNEKLSESDMRILASALGAGALPRLRTLVLDKFAVHDGDDTALILNGKGLDDTDVAIVAQLLANGALASLRTLSLFNNHIGDEGACALAAAAMGGAMGHLEDLGLGNNSIGDTGAAALSHACAQGAFDALVSMNLGGNTASDAAMQSVQDELRLRSWTGVRTCQDSSMRLSARPISPSSPSSRLSAQL